MSKEKKINDFTNELILAFTDLTSKEKDVNEKRDFEGHGFLFHGTYYWRNNPKNSTKFIAYKVIINKKTNVIKKVWRYIKHKDMYLLASIFTSNESKMLVVQPVFLILNSNRKILPEFKDRYFSDFKFPPYIELIWSLDNDFTSKKSIKRREKEERKREKDLKKAERKFIKKSVKIMNKNSKILNHFNGLSSKREDKKHNKDINVKY